MIAADHMRIVSKIFVQFDALAARPGVTAGVCVPIVREIAVVFWRQHLGSAAGA